LRLAQRPKIARNPGQGGRQVAPGIGDLTSVHFTDDADLHWQIDRDMHLQALDERDR